MDSRLLFFIICLTLDVCFHFMSSSCIQVLCFIFPELPKAGFYSQKYHYLSTVIISLIFRVRTVLSFIASDTEIVVGNSFSHCCSYNKQHLPVILHSVNWSSEKCCGLSRSTKYELILKSHCKNRTPWASTLGSYWTSITTDILIHLFFWRREGNICHTLVTFNMHLI